MSEIQSDQRFAAPLQRLVARIIDTIILAILFFAVYFTLRALFTTTTSLELGNGMTLGQTSGPGGWLVYVLGALISFLYEVSLTATRGQTVGKMIVGVTVVADGTTEPPGWGRAFMRWLATIAMGLIPLLPLLDVLWLLWDRKKQCLHDKVAGTVVNENVQGGGDVA